MAQVQKLRVPKYVAIPYMVHQESTRKVINRDTCVKDTHVSSILETLNWLPIGRQFTASKINMNYVTVPVDNNINDRIIPTPISKVLDRTDWENKGDKFYINGSPEDVSLIQRWSNLKGINAAIYDGENSFIGDVIRALESDGLIAKITKSRKKKKVKECQKATGSVSPASRQYKYQGRIIATNRELITFDDVFKSDVSYRSKRKVSEAIYNKLSKANSLFNLYRVHICPDQEKLRAKIERYLNFKY